MKKCLNCKLVTPIRYLCKHLMNENYSFLHRMFIGVIIAVAGVYLASFETHLFVGKLLTEGVGFAFHGIGVLPIVERVQKFSLDNN